MLNKYYIQGFSGGITFGPALEGKVEFLTIGDAQVGAGPGGGVA